MMLAIRRLTISEMKEPVAGDIPIERYSGPKKPQKPTKEGTRAVLPLKVLSHQVVQLSHAQFLDFQFFKHVVADNDTPEYSRFIQNRQDNKDSQLNQLQEPFIRH